MAFSESVAVVWLMLALTHGQGIINSSISSGI